LANGRAQAGALPFCNLDLPIGGEGEGAPRRKVRTVHSSFENYSHELIQSLRRLGLRLDIARPRPQAVGVEQAQASTTPATPSVARSQPAKVFHIHHGTEAAEHLLDQTPWRGRHWSMASSARDSGDQSLPVALEKFGPVS
jgi:hypothetical protein